MAQSESIARGGGEGRIDIHDAAQCAHWSRELNVTAGELKAAVHHVGPEVEAVRRYIEARTLPPLGRDAPGEG
jgi:hypothetical protein